jgi:hypothetical protein
VRPVDVLAVEDAPAPRKYERVVRVELVLAKRVGGVHVLLAGELVDRDVARVERAVDHVVRPLELAEVRPVALEVLDALRVGVRDVHAALAVDVDRARPVEATGLDAERVAPLADERAGGRELEQPVDARVGHPDELVHGVERHPARTRQAAEVPGPEARLAELPEIDAGRAEHLDAAVPGVEDVDLAGGGIDCDAVRGRELAVSGARSAPLPDERAVRGVLLHQVLVVDRDVDVTACLVHVDASAAGAAPQQQERAVAVELLHARGLDDVHRARRVVHRVLDRHREAARRVRRADTEAEQERSVVHVGCARALRQSEREREQAGDQGTHPLTSSDAA